MAGRKSGQRRQVSPGATVTDQELLHAFDQYQRGRGLADTTRRRRTASLDRFTDFLAPRSITTTRPDDVDQWLAGLNAAGTKAGYYSDLKAFFQWAHRREHVALNPMSLTDPPRKPKYLPKPARPDVIATAVAMSSGPVQLMILLGALAGLRVGEIAALSSDDIYLDRMPAVLMVRQGKGGKDRIVPLHPVLVERLRGVRRGWLFPSPDPDREHIAGQHVGVTVSKALSAASSTGQHTTAHQLRHYFGSEAAKWSGGNVVLVGGMMGHSDPKTTMGYIGWTPEDGADVVARLGGGRADELAAKRRAAGPA